ncbi:hypothetical protein GLAREA_09334 [Glarea lozoyensis ATCC 20868]|uniref:Rhodopsin domain-containing protein n=1 Tax=Glarea lozoyensis (strain ATCC 20868 / MF5171) TaxID=1116229 RepID=S3DZ09_GLAL2|nr:uncharacterized protein GLAREA_09334 [Glarea lozoyensis ATCC 20868]EPE37171.1 hypothetical protein GLAREA_09334 [Glarea lozoyensis ATCC 20868]
MSFDAIIAALPYDTPAIPPPEGVKPHFDNPHTRGPVIIAVGTIMFVLVLAFAAARLYVSTFVVKKRNLGDILCLFAFLGSFGYFINVCIDVHLGQIGKHEWNVRLTDVLAGPFLISSGLVTACLLSPTLLLAKIAIFALYLEVFRPFKWMRICVYVGSAITTVFYVVSTIGFIYLTVKKPGESWQMHAISADSMLSQKLFIPHRAVGLGIDLYLFILPLKAVSDLHLPLKKKLEVMVVFLMGSLACVASALNVYYAQRLYTEKDVTWIAVEITITALVEMDVGVIVACMPAFSKLIHIYRPSLLPSIRSSNFRSRFGKLSNSRSDSEAGPPSSQGDGDTEMAPVPSLTQYRIMEDGSRVPFELNHIKSVSTHIHADTPRKRSEDDQIHLKKEIWQN